jgi:phosphohistidine phosphatase
VKILHLLRHAKAEPPATVGSSDHARPLARRGQKAAQALSEHLASEAFTVDRVYCSTATRARETLAPLRTLLAGVPVAFRDSLYMIEPEPLFDFLRELPEGAGSVMVVGHNPTFHHIALRLVKKAGVGANDGLQALRQKFPTGTLCTIACDVSSWHAIGPKCGTLTGYLRPKDIAD